MARWLNRLDSALGHALGSDVQDVEDETARVAPQPTSTVSSSEALNDVSEVPTSDTPSIDDKHCEESQKTAIVEDSLSVSETAGARHLWETQTPIGSVGSTFSMADICAVCYDVWGDSSVAPSEEVQSQSDQNMGAAESVLQSGSSATHFCCARCQRRCHLACLGISESILPCDPSCGGIPPTPLEGANVSGTLHVTALAARCCSLGGKLAPKFRNARLSLALDGSCKVEMENLDMKQHSPQLQQQHLLCQLPVSALSEATEVIRWEGASASLSHDPSGDSGAARLDPTMLVHFQVDSLPTPPLATLDRPGSHETATFPQASSVGPLDGGDDKDGTLAHGSSPPPLLLPLKSGELHAHTEVSSSSFSSSGSTPRVWSLSVPLMPLLIHPSVALERWFSCSGGSNTAGAAAADAGGDGDDECPPAFLLLRLSFEPNQHTQEHPGRQPDQTPTVPIDDRGEERAAEESIGHTVSKEEEAPPVVEEPERVSVSPVFDIEEPPPAAAAAAAADVSDGGTIAAGASVSGNGVDDSVADGDDVDDLVGDGDGVGGGDAPPLLLPASTSGSFEESIEFADAENVVGGGNLEDDYANGAKEAKPKPVLAVEEHGNVAAVVVAEVPVKDLTRTQAGFYLVPEELKPSITTALLPSHLEPPQPSPSAAPSPPPPSAAPSSPPPVPSLAVSSPPVPPPRPAAVPTSSLLPPLLPSPPLPPSDAAAAATLPPITAAFPKKKKSRSSRLHLFRVATLRRPGWCAACGKLLVGVYHQGHACELCGLLVHAKCQQPALTSEDASLHCPPSLDASLAPLPSPPSTASALPSSTAANLFSSEPEITSRQGFQGQAPVEEGEGRRGGDAVVNLTTAATTASAPATGGGAAAVVAAATAAAAAGVTSADNASPLPLPISPPTPPSVGVGTAVVEVLLAHRCSHACCDAPLSWLASARHPNTLGHCSAFLSPLRRQRAVSHVATTAAAHRSLSAPLTTDAASSSLSPSPLTPMSPSPSSSSSPLLSSFGSSTDGEHSRHDGSGLSAEEEAAAEANRVAQAEMDQAHGIAQLRGEVKEGLKAGGVGSEWSSDKGLGEEDLKGSDLFVRLFMGGSESGRTPTCFSTRTASFATEAGGDDDSACSGAIRAGEGGGENSKAGAAAAVAAAAAAEVVVEGARFQLTAPHHKASLALHLIDASSDRVFGALELPVLKLLQRELDAKAEGWEHGLDSFVDLPLLVPQSVAAKRGGIVGGGSSSSSSSASSSLSSASSLAAWSVADPTPWPVEAVKTAAQADTNEEEESGSSDGKKKSSGSSSGSSAGGADDNSEAKDGGATASKEAEAAVGGATWGAGPGPRELICSEVAGFVRVRLRYHEAPDLCQLWPLPPRPVPPAPKEEFSVATFQKHVTRASAVISWVGSWLKAYNRIITWEHPGQSAFALLVFVWVCLFADAEYAPCLPAALLVLHLAKGYWHRTGGGFVTHWLEESSFTAGVFGIKDNFVVKPIRSSSSSTSSSTSLESSPSMPPPANTSLPPSETIPGPDSVASLDYIEGDDDKATALTSDNALGDDGFSPLALLRVAVIQGHHLGLRRRVRKANKRHSRRHQRRPPPTVPPHLSLADHDQEGGNQSSVSGGISSGISGGVSGGEDLAYSRGHENDLDDEDDVSSVGSVRSRGGSEGSGTYGSVDFEDFPLDHFSPSDPPTSSPSSASSSPTLSSSNAPTTTSSAMASSARVETYEGQRGRYYVQVTFVPDSLPPRNIARSARSPHHRPSDQRGRDEKEGGGELFIGHTRYSARTHNPIWAHRDSLTALNASNHDGDNQSGGAGRDSAVGGSRGVGKSEKRRAGGASGLFRPLLEAFLPDEQSEHSGGGGLGGGGGEGGGGGVGGDGRPTVHSVKRSWRRTVTSSWREEDEEDPAFFYHVLQPRNPSHGNNVDTQVSSSLAAASSGSHGGSSGGGRRRSSRAGGLVPWGPHTPGCLRFRVLVERGDDVAFGDGAPVMADQCVAQLDVPLSQLVSEGGGSSSSRSSSGGDDDGDASVGSGSSSIHPSGAQAELERWLPLCWPGGTQPLIAAGDQRSQTSTPTAAVDVEGLNAAETSHPPLASLPTSSPPSVPSLHLRVQLVLRDRFLPVTEDEREVSASVEAALKRATERETHRTRRRGGRSVVSGGDSRGGSSGGEAAGATSARVQTEGNSSAQTDQEALDTSLREDEEGEDDDAFLSNLGGFLGTALGELGSSVADSSGGNGHGGGRSGDGCGGGHSDSRSGFHEGEGLSTSGGMAGNGGNSLRRQQQQQQQQHSGAVHRAVSLLPTGRAGADDWFEGQVGLRSVSDTQGEGGGALSTILGLRETAAFVQNGLGGTLDMLEQGKNLLNWSHPQRTSLVLAASVGLWLVFVLVPFRFLLLGAGLFEFFKKFLPSPAPEENAAPPVPFYLLDNLLACAPTDESLRLSYAHEAKFLAALGEDSRRGRRRRARLRLLHGCQWDGAVVRVCMSGGDQGGSSSSSGAGIVDEFLTAGGGGRGGGGGGAESPLVLGPGGWVRGGFAVLQGRRLLWWRAEALLEAGSGADACLVLRGHAGVTAPSPNDLRAAPAARLCVVFCVEPPNGRRGGPANGSRKRWTFVFADEAERTAFAGAVERALDKND